MCSTATRLHTVDEPAPAIVCVTSVAERLISERLTLHQDTRRRTMPSRSDLIHLRCLLGTLIVIASLIFLTRQVIEIVATSPADFLSGVDPLVFILAVFVIAYVVIDEIQRVRPAASLNRIAPWLLTALFVVLVVLNYDALGAWVAELGFAEALSLSRDFLQILLWPLVALVVVTVFRHPLAQLMGWVKKASSPWGDDNIDFETEAADVADDARVVETEEPIRSTGDTSARNDAGTSTEAKSTRGSEGSIDGRVAPPTSPEEAKALSVGRLREWNAVEQDMRWKSLRAWSPDESEDNERYRTQLLGEFVVEWAFLEENARDLLSVLYPEHKRTPGVPIGTPVRLVFKELARRGLIDADAYSVAQRAQSLRNKVLHTGAGPHSTSSLTDLVSTVRSLKRTLERAAVVVRGTSDSPA